MCGIAGVFGRASLEIATAMRDTIPHRGPDDSGQFFEDGVAFGHRRLSIIDVSSCGHQPMSYAGGRYHIVYNGEIYNFAEIREELEKFGHRFVSHSDTEVILASYAQWGDESVSRLRGMFAFAIYDRDRRELFLARDRFGIKPLYYTIHNGSFLFASELKALLASGEVPRELDAEALWFYLSLGSVPQPRTALANVSMLPAGHTMRIRRDLTLETKRYWDLADTAERQIDAETATRRLRELLEEATRYHMIADVPVGAFLSGGIDSTAVVGLMSRASGQRIRTFSVGFSDDGTVTDEREWARLAARKFDCEHTDVVVTGEEVAAQFDVVIRAIDQPSLDGTNTFLVARAAARELKVALSGLGGDELFAGYPHFKRLDRAAKWDRARRVIAHVPGRLFRDRDFVAAPTAQRYATLRNLADDQTKLAIINPDIRVSEKPMAALYEPLLLRTRDSVAQTTYVETRRYLADTLLRDADAMAMASSLEVRPVLLDHKLAEFAFALPAKLKLGAINKPIFVDAVRDILPPELIARKKTGFELPLQSWLIGPLRDRGIAAFSSDAARTLFAKPFLSETVAALEQRRRPSLRVWAYLVLVEWFRTYNIAV
jgi:asparagine synthase (glutamine-hydrolysing)